MKIVKNYVNPPGELYSRAQKEWIALFNESNIPITVQDGPIYKCLESDFFAGDSGRDQSTGIQPVNELLFPGW